MADDLGEKTEEPTQKRRQEARDEGNVAKSQDFSAAILLIAATLALAAASMWLLEEGATLIELALDSSALGDPLQPDHGWELTVFLSSHAVRLAMPILLIGWMAGVLGVMLQIGWLFTSKAVQPKLSKLNPLKGFQRIFGISGLVKVSLDSLKVLIIAVISTLTMYQYADRILVLPYLTVLQSLREIGWLMFDLALRVLAVLLVLGVLDLIYQKWKQTKDLRMTKQQVKDEMKQTDGDPETKKRRMRMQQEIASQRVASSVPKADVIVTNPEHISIAIQYDQDKMNAPRVIAKGADFLALRIRQIAMMHNIPIVERKPLARALYKDVPVGSEIPPDFYQAVAEILAYVYGLTNRKAG